MAAETWLDATDALELGLADKVIEPVRIAASFDIPGSAMHRLIWLKQWKSPAHWAKLNRC
jgi:hypothetical protein